ncbi:MAG: MipA/OmpV family protein [Rhodospirillales bacterium]|nr:MipA/OmpV family protein [Rhodospirillales bacterium]
MRTIGKILGGLALLLASGPTQAAEAIRQGVSAPPDKPRAEKPVRTAAAQPAAATDPDQPKTWDVTLGLAAIMFPKYEGADAVTVWPLPYIDVKWKDTIFLNTFEGLGWNAWKTRNFRVGPVVTYVLPGDKISGANDTDFGIYGGLFAEFAFDYWKFDAKILQSLMGSSEGQKAEIGMGAGIKLERKVSLFARLSTSWASENEMKTYFGLSDREASDVTQFQNAKPKVLTYAPGAGMKDVALSLNVGWDVSERWKILGEGKYAYLLGDAADSPLVDRFGSANQFTLWTGVAYKF